MSKPEAAERLYLLGHPIAHSKSPVMYNAVYERLGLPWTYGLADCATDEKARAFLAARAFLSINITTPYKPHALEAATAKDATASLAQGANVLVRQGEALIAYNTDGQGCISFLERTGFVFAGKRVAVCGTGPTALSILHAATVAGAESVVLIGRDRERTRRVLASYVERFGLLANALLDQPPARPHHRSLRVAYERTHFEFGSYEADAQDLALADLVVNATPLGMHANDPAPFNTAVLRPGQTVFDAVYGHGETALVRAARKAGCTVRDGGGMLVAQAVATVFILCGLEGIDVPLSERELFDLMASVAQFDLLGIATA